MKVAELAASTEGTTLYSVISKMLRYPITKAPDELEFFDEFLLVDAYQFFKASTIFPDSLPDISYLEYLFLIEAYRANYEDQNASVYSPQFQKGMTNLDRIDDNVTR